jgi:peptide/nickel transport system permease protein
MARKTDRGRIQRYKGPVKRALRGFVDLYKGERFAQFGMLILLVLIFAALFAPAIAPYEPDERIYDEGELVRYDAPSTDHYLGTNEAGRDVFSQLVYGSRVSLAVGLMAAFMATFIGTNMALIGGYYRGWIDELFMRAVDLAYGTPFIPLAIVVIFIFGDSLRNIIIVIGLVMWRSSARTLRSEVLSQKERPYVESAKAIGVSDFRLLYYHIFPNILPLAVLYTAFGVAWAILWESSLSFLGFGDPNLISWGHMINRAYFTGGYEVAPWWVIPPGIAIMLAVMSVFFIGRSLEKITDPDIGK